MFNFSITNSRNESINILFNYTLSNSYIPSRAVNTYIYP
nr:MAG TPA: hypothetical protein [Caudoviricetes sp.]